MAPANPEPRNHVFIIDGTLSRLDEGEETNAGLLYKLLAEQGVSRAQTFGYDPGVQGEGLRKWLIIAAGMGIGRSIRHAYSTLASRYRPGDRIFLFGYSRGAYAVRSLAGLISRIGLLRHDVATERRIVRAYRYYEGSRITEAAQAFSRHYCHRDVEIEFVGIWDTVAALGLPYPILNRLAPMATEFHDTQLSNTVRNAFHALAIDENRVSYSPILWETGPDYSGRIEQIWFPGTHGDIGGQVRLRPAARNLANIPLTWILDQAESCGLRLPEGWQSEFPLNPIAPMVGSYVGTGRFFIARRPRVVGECASEAIHSAVNARMAKRKRYQPKALITLPGFQIPRGRRWPARPLKTQPTPSKPEPEPPEGEAKATPAE